MSIRRTVQEFVQRRTLLPDRIDSLIAARAVMSAG